MGRVDTSRSTDANGPQSTRHMESNHTDMRDQMHRLLTAFLATMFGGSCGSASTRMAVSREDDGLRHRSHAHEPGHAGPHAGHGASGGHHAFADADALTKVFDDPSRDAWQRPDEVLRALELTPTMVVADVGAGTGYFAVRLARAVPRGEVIATDVEPNLVRFVNERARREQLPNLHAIRAPLTASGLAASSVDRILVVHVWHHLADRIRFARDLTEALRPGGRLFVIDFSPDARRGPPPDMRVSQEALVEELKAAGLAARASPIELPDQYIVEATKER